MKTTHTKYPSLAQATGIIDYPLTNDMIFHMIMQRSNRALKGLVCALKGLDPASVKSVRLTNEVDYNTLGKEIILDVLVVLNDDERLNIELQIYKNSNWIKRSLLYLGRAFDTIGEGDDYSLLLPTTQIGILGYDLFPEQPEFYARYLMTNVRNGNLYSPIYGLNVLSLNQIERATEEDRKSGLVYWAELFKATTWENLKALAPAREEFREVMNLMYEANTDEKQRAVLNARRKFREIVTTEKNELLRENARLNQELDQSRSEADHYRKEYEQSRQRIADLEALLAAKG